MYLDRHAVLVESCLECFLHFISWLHQRCYYRVSLTFTCQVSFVTFLDSTSSAYYCWPLMLSLHYYHCLMSHNLRALAWTLPLPDLCHGFDQSHCQITSWSASFVSSCQHLVFWFVLIYRQLDYQSFECLNWRCKRPPQACPATSYYLPNLHSLTNRLCG